MANQEGGFSGSCLLLSFCIGSLVGAGVALLVAPKTGRETRQQIKELADEVKEKADVYMEQMKDQVSTVVEKGKGIIEEQKSILAAAVEAGKEAYDKEKEKLVKE